MVRSTQKLRQQRLFIIQSLVVSVILLLIFVCYPAVKLFQMGLTNWNGYSLKSDFIGMKNYQRLMHDAVLWLSLKNNLIYFIVSLIRLPFELAIAVMLTTKMKAAKFYKFVIFMPYIINGVAISYAFSYFFTPINGAFNFILTSLGCGNCIQQWLSNPSLVNFTLAFVALWKSAGFHVILFIAALGSINGDLLEAATIDGAGAWRKFIHVQLPEISLIIDFILFTNLQGSLQVFDIPFIMTNGGPNNASSTFTLYAIKTAFDFNDFGMAGAMSVLMILIVIILSLIQNKGVAYLRTSAERKVAKKLKKGGTV